jgi:EmrB/QacA subfamily drug resistance transporter
METPQKINKKTVLFVTMLVSFLIPCMGSSVNVALPSIGKELGMNAVLLGWIAMAYLLPGAIFLVPFGRMADIHGRRRIFLYGLFFYTGSAFLAALSPSSAWLIFFRGLQGVSGAMIFSTALPILAAAFPLAERGKMMGINVASTYLGLSLGPFLGGLLTEQIGWRSLFWINVPLGLVMIASVWLRLKGEWAEAQGEKFDVVGSLIYGVSLTALIYGLSLLPGRSGAALALAGGFGLWLFSKYEMSISYPIFDISLFRENRVFTFSNLAALINYSATFAVGFLISLYLQYTQGLSPQQAGLVLVSQPLVQAAFSPFTGRLSDRMEPRIVASIGMGFCVLGLTLFTRVGEQTPLAFIIGNLLLLGLGFALFSSPNTNAVMSSVEKKFLGVAAGTLGTMRSTGMMFSMAIVMLIFSIIMGKTQITPALYPLFLKSMRIAFHLLAILCLAGIFASLARGKMH